MNIISIIDLIRCRLKKIILHLLRDIIDLEVVLRLQQDEYDKSNDSERASYWEEKFDANEFSKRLVALGNEVCEQTIDIPAFITWMDRNEALVTFYAGFGAVKIEKLLEHFATVTHLEISPEDIVVDVAGANSPFAEVLRSKGITAYRQDITYKPVIKGYDIGGDAGDMPVHDQFADVLTLHCAYECFQGDADTRFASSVDRLLKPGGRLGIVPLYLDTIHFVKTSPNCDKRKIQVEPEAKWLWRDDQYTEPFSRHYSPESFTERIVSCMPGLKKRILYFTNIDELSSHFKNQRIYCHFMFFGEKE